MTPKLLVYDPDHRIEDALTRDVVGTP